MSSLHSLFFLTIYYQLFYLLQKLLHRSLIKEEQYLFINLIFRLHHPVLPSINHFCPQVVKLLPSQYVLVHQYLAFQTVFKLKRLINCEYLTYIFNSMMSFFARCSNISIIIIFIRYFIITNKFLDDYCRDRFSFLEFKKIIIISCNL